ncbi:GlsB/YeaQ/YmgE family stress response membrane protein [Lacimonas salitolerans]|uniref:GlsB/YeaQ/YmgE family stress response membrane protein n=1 Tax=Lacimonas salitolerans TaxID=1323750 RepID=A0ABW4EJY2_9RHOB
MTAQSIIVILIVGAIGGWLAGLIMKGGGFGLLGNIVMGIVGAFVAGLVLPAIGLNIGGGLLGAIVNATIGAVIVIFLIRLVKRV